jgi:hypothetical protein
MPIVRQSLAAANDVCELRRQKLRRFSDGAATRRQDHRTRPLCPADLRPQIECEYRSRCYLRSNSRPYFFAAHRGTAAAATTSASMRRSMSCIQEQPTEGVRPNANGKWPDQTLERRSDGRECREPSTLSHLGFQPVQQTSTIHASSGFIGGIPMKAMDRIVSAILAGSANRYRALWALFAILVTLCALLRKFSNWPHVWDIELSDETMYLGAGLTNVPDLMQNYEWGPLYSKFYNLIASLTGAEAPSVFMIGGLSVLLLGSFGMAIGVFAGSGSLSLSILSILVFFHYMYNPLRVSWLCVFILGAGFSLCTLCPERFAKAAILALTCFLATFVRPEYAVGFYLSIAIVLAAFIELNLRELPQRNANLVIGFAALATITILAMLWCFPIAQGGSRAFIAFGQHYAGRAVMDRDLSLEPWLNWEQIVGADFPGAKSLGDALRVHPGLVIVHLLKNAFGINSRPWGAFCTGTILVAAWLCRPWAKFVKQSDRSRADNVLCATVLLVPPTIAIITVFPRPHYVLLALTALLFLFASATRMPLARVIKRRLTPTHMLVSKVNDNLVSVGLAVLMLIVARPLPIVRQPTLATVTSMPSIGKVSTMLEAGGGYCYYLKPICKPLYSWNVPDGIDIKIFLDQEGVDAVAVEPYLFKASWLANNPTFEKFVETATKNGWIRHDLPAPGGESYLYVLIRTSPQS